ncbi:zinc-dependent alcohol dehydrogenase family protein [Haloarcula nitratireducens]|uniref:Zinc-dependent alcohol dehydrogenase family protein n=1 Tax=Haloarcula nitratireducens TaxID=2487749 RepID=A0AAW4PFE2_9EURY|nr:zinc-dependent alcohol dehydrogenase family protein [Halomicroarcula nitratireducens]MBX0296452.1 zinc-dependent alcohol dehydrogenase family protein [Halomicroarcula nitratireducens]
MRAAVFTGHGDPLEMREVDEPTAAPTGVVVETQACGICRSDWHAWQGDPAWEGRGFEDGHVFGHEPAGVVVEVGDEVEEVREGDHVTVPFNLGDGTCPACRDGHSNLCDERIPFGLTPESPGAFAERFHVPWADYNVVPLPPGISPVEMAGLGCRFMTSFHALAHRADLTGGDRVAVHGCGGVGLSAVHIADALGANVVAVDLFAEKLDTASELGAVETVDAEAVDDVPAAVRAVTDGGADVSVDALGISETCRNSVESLRKRGQHLQIGLTSSEDGGEISLPTDAMVAKELQFVGSFGMPRPRYDEIFRMIAHGKLDPAAVVSETVSLDAVPEKLAAMTDFGTSGIPVVEF